MKSGGAVDTHGARDKWMCVFVYRTDHENEPAAALAPMRFTEAYISQVVESDFRKNARGDLGTRTATLDRSGISESTRELGLSRKGLVVEIRRLEYCFWR